MKRGIPLARVAALIWTAACVHAAGAADVALVTAVKGAVTMQRPGKAEWRGASAMQGLPAGSKMQAGAGAQATLVLLGNGARFVVPAGAVVAVSATACQGVSGPAPRPLPALALRHQKILQASLVAAGRPAAAILRGGEHIVILQSLSDTSILTGRPVFKWQPVPGAASYKVKLWNGKDDLLWQVEVTSATVAYPAQSPELKPDVEYVWAVTTNVNDIRYEGKGLFRVLTPEKRQAVQEQLAGLADMEDEETATLLRAEVYYHNDLADDAIASYEALAAQYPDSPAVHSALAELLAAQGRRDDSKKHRAEAERLSK